MGQMPAAIGKQAPMTARDGDDTPPDHQLVAAAQAGDKAAFDALVARYQVQIEGFLRRDVGNAVRAADLAQDTFDEAYASLARLRAPPAFRAWLYGIASNLALMDHRWRRRQATLALSALRSDMPAPSLTRLQIEEALGHLSPTLRRVLLLHDVEGYDVREIGTILRISESAAQKRLSRAHAAFRGLYADDDTPEGL